MERMERNTKINVKASATQKCMFESRCVCLKVGMFYFFSWFFLSDIRRVRDVHRTEIASGHNTTNKITYHRCLTDHESYVLLLDGRLS